MTGRGMPVRQKGKTRSWTGRLIAAAVFLFAGLPASGHAQDLSNRALLEYFDIAAFNAEHETRREKTILKWAGPINVAIIGRTYPDYVEKLIVDHLADLRRETGLNIRLVYSEVMQREKRVPKNIREIKINLPLFIIPRARLPESVEKNTNGAFKAADVRRIMAASHCHGRIRHGKKGISFAYIAIAGEVPTQTQYGKTRVDPKLFAKACVVEELTQVLGLINDSDALEFSIFNDKSRAIDLTEPDRWMLRMLYDPRIRPGMHRATALPIVRRFLSERRPSK